MSLTFSTARLATPGHLGVGAEAQLLQLVAVAVHVVAGVGGSGGEAWAEAAGQLARGLDSQVPAGGLRHADQ